jgi:Mor family transcriptional regulator
MKPWTVLANDLLPQRLQEIVRLIGLQATLSLVERLGGLRIYIPAEATPEHPIAALIGVENLAKLCAEYSVDGIGLRFELPNAKRALNAVRNAQIREQFAASKSVRDLAAEHRLTERHVTRIVADMELKDAQQTSWEF